MGVGSVMKTFTWATPPGGVTSFEIFSDTGTMAKSGIDRITPGASRRNISDALPSGLYYFVTLLDDAAPSGKAPSANGDFTEFLQIPTNCRNLQQRGASPAGDRAEPDCPRVA